MPGRTDGFQTLPSQQFQALFNSLFKVLFIFPSRYLFAIGLSSVFSLRRDLPPILYCIPKQYDSSKAPRGAAKPRADGVLTLSDAAFQRTWAPVAAEGASLDYNSSKEDFQVGLFPFHSPLLGESWLVSFPPLIDMLKFSGCSCLSSGRRCEFFSVTGAPEKFLLGSQHGPLGQRQAVVGGAYLPSHCPANGVHAQASVLQPTRAVLLKEPEPGGPGPPSHHRSGEGEGVNRR